MSEADTQQNRRCIDKLKGEFRSLRRTVIGDPDYLDEGLVGSIRRHELEIKQIKEDMSELKSKTRQMILYVSTAAGIGAFTATMIFQLALHLIG